MLLKYDLDRLGSLELRVTDNIPRLDVKLRDLVEDVAGIPLDNVHIAFENFGLVTIHTNNQGSVSSLEWWINQFLRRS
jgi:hypothetical protein